MLDRSWAPGQDCMYAGLYAARRAHHTFPDYLVAKGTGTTANSSHAHRPPLATRMYSESTQRRPTRLLVAT